MAASGILSVASQKKCRSIKSALASAVLEWLLMLLLFIDGIFSYLITKFACYCELQTPCLLCSRLDRILGKYYWDLICGKHKVEISCLVLCHAHNKLVDVHGMCEACLFSFATINKSNAETYRLLVGKLGETSGFDMNEGPLHEDHTSSTRICSCCNSLWIPKGYRRNLLEMTIIGSSAAYDQNNMTKVEEPRPFRSGHQKISTQSNPLSHIIYKELKVHSDTESEVPFSDESDDAVNFRSREFSPTQNVGIRRVQMEPRVVRQPNDLAVEKLIDAVSELQPPVSVSQIRSDSSESNDVRIISSKAAHSNGLEEFCWQKVDNKYDSSAFPEFISIDDVSIAKETPIEVSREIKHCSLEDDVPSFFDAKQTPAEEAKEVHIATKDVSPSSVKSAEMRERFAEDDVFEFEDANETLVEESTERKLKSLDEVPSSSVSGEAIAEALLRSKLFSEDDELPWSESIVRTLSSSRLISLVDVLPSPSGIETPVEGLKEAYIPKPEDILQATVDDSDESDSDDNCKTITTADAITETALETIPVSAENCQQVLNMLDLGDAYKLAVSSRGKQLSGVLAEQWTGKDSSRISDDLKLLFSQFSNTREQSINDMSPGLSLSPKYSLTSEELKNTDALTAAGMQKIQNRISPERIALERNESGQSLDGSIVSEIDGEAVVDRLARQIEHDKKLLGGLYKELEEERNSSSIAVNQAMAMITRLQEEKATLQMEALQCVRMMEEQAEYDMEALQKTNDLLTAREKEIQDLEAELEYYRIKYPDEYLLEETMMEPLFDMKTKIIKEENIEASTSTPKESVTESEKPDTSSKSVTESEKPDTSSEVEENTVSMKNLLLDIEDERSCILRSLKDLEKKLCRFPDYQLSLALNEYSGENGPNEDPSLSVDIAESNEMFYTPVVPNLDILANEVHDLNERLKALEADRSLIEHSLNSVRDGEDGVKFVQEIASHLGELRKIGIRSGK